jgi:ABC-type dipeptide/oligopeptide/nickel transport system permease component
MPTEGVPWFEEEMLTDNAQFDPERANRILDDLGLTKRDGDGMRTLPEGSRLTLYMIARPGSTAPLQFLIDDWRAVGLRVILKEKPHRLYMQSSRNADLTTGGDGTAGALSWTAFGAGHWEWYYKGGLYGSEDSKVLPVQPTPIEIEAMQAGQDAANSFDPAERLRLARKVMNIARDQVWTINVATATAPVCLVKKGLKGVPRELLFSFMLNSPNNSCPEAWYWDKPDTINGAEAASAAYLQDRRQAIIGEILTATPKEGRGSTTAANSKTAHSILGNLFKWCCLGILLVGLVLLVLRHPFVLRRIIIMVPTLVIISIIVYTGVQMPPGSYLQTVIDNLEQSGKLEQAQEEIKNVTETYHLDDGPVKSYCRWTGLLWFTSFSKEDTGLLQGNLGRSMSNDGAFVSDLLGDRVLLTACISLGTILLTWLIAIPIGVYSAVRQYSIADYVLTVGGFIGMCVPQFILALVLMLLAKEVFGLTMMGLFSGQYAIQEYWNWAKVVDLLKHIWLPIIIVGAAGTAGMIRVMRANLLDELKKPYVTTARAKGVRPLKLLFKYPFRMALNPFVSGIGRLFPMLISGSAIVAIILSLPTVGPLLLNAVMYEDTYMAGSLLLILSAFSVFGVLVSDLLLMLLDPRIRMEGGNK